MKSGAGTAPRPSSIIITTAVHPRRGRLVRISKRRTAVIAAAVSATFALAGISPAVHAQSTGRRMMGIDVSDWQNQNGPTGDTPIDWATVHAPTAQGGGGKDFAFIRSSRGGT